jgi:hypothetical protein
MALHEGAVLVQLSREVFVSFLAERPKALQIYLEQGLARLWRVANFILSDYLDLELPTGGPLVSNWGKAHPLGRVGSTAGSPEPNVLVPGSRQNNLISSSSNTAGHAVPDLQNEGMARTGYPPARASTTAYQSGHGSFEQPGAHTTRKENIPADILPCGSQVLGDPAARQATTPAVSANTTGQSMQQRNMDPRSAGAAVEVQELRRSPSRVNLFNTKLSLSGEKSSEARSLFGSTASGTVAHGHSRHESEAGRSRHSDIKAINDTFSKADVSVILSPSAASMEQNITEHTPASGGNIAANSFQDGKAPSRLESFATAVSGSDAPSSSETSVDGCERLASIGPPIGQYPCTSSVSTDAVGSATCGAPLVAAATPACKESIATGLGGESATGEAGGKAPLASSAVHGSLEVAGVVRQQSVMHTLYTPAPGDLHPAPGKAEAEAPQIESSTHVAAAGCEVSKSANTASLSSGQQAGAYVAQEARDGGEGTLMHGHKCTSEGSLIAAEFTLAGLVNTDNKAAQCIVDSSRKTNGPLSSSASVPDVNLGSSATFDTTVGPCAADRMSLSGAASPSGSSATLAPSMPSENRAFPATSPSGNSPSAAENCMQSETGTSLASPSGSSPTIWQLQERYTHAPTGELSMCGASGSAPIGTATLCNHAKSSGTHPVPVTKDPQGSNAFIEASQKIIVPAIDREAVEFLQSQLRGPETAEVGTSPMPSMVLNGSHAVGVPPVDLSGFWLLCCRPCHVCTPTPYRTCCCVTF